MARIKYTLRGPGIVRGPLLRVPKLFIDWHNYGSFRREFTFSNGAHWQAKGVGVRTSDDAQVEAFREDDSYFYVPRHSYETVKGYLNKRGSAWLSIHGEPFDSTPPLTTFRASAPVWFLGELRNQVQTDSVSALLTPGDKVLALGCGVGKTVVSLAAMASSSPKKFPVLVVAHTNDLLDQWKERIQTFLPGASVGRVQGPQSTWDYEGRHITLATLQTLAKNAETAPIKFRKYFNLVVFDEAHRLGAQWFGQASSMFWCERWGLSATIKRSDNMDRVIHMHCGEVAYSYLEQDLKATVYFVPTFIQDGACYLWGKVHLPKTYTKLMKNEKRSQLVLDWIHAALETGRNVLVLGERVEQLHWWLERTNCDSKSLCTGAVKDRKGVLDHRVVYATQHLAKEGLDHAAFDTLFIPYPFGDAGRFRQSVGRILRTLEGKKAPRVIVFEDSIGICQALCNKMRRASKELGFRVVDMASSFPVKRTA